MPENTDITRTVAKGKGVGIGPEDSQLVVWSSPSDFVGRGQETIKALLLKGPEVLGEAKQSHTEGAHKKQETHTLIGATGKKKRSRTIGVRHKPLKYRQPGHCRIEGIISKHEGNNNEDEMDEEREEEATIGQLLSAEIAKRSRREQ